MPATRVAGIFLCRLNRSSIYRLDENVYRRRQAIRRTQRESRHSFITTPRLNLEKLLQSHRRRRLEVQSFCDVEKSPQIFCVERGHQVYVHRRKLAAVKIGREATHEQVTSLFFFERTKQVEVEHRPALIRPVFSPTPATTLAEGFSSSSAASMRWNCC